MAEQNVPVVIVGGSLVGLTTSVLLSQHGIPNVVVERHRGTAIHPRAASFHQRTMEIFRQAGIQKEVEAAAEKEFQQHGAIVAVETLCGKELQYFSKSWSAGVEDLSPTQRLFITQIGLEPILRRRAQELGADHRYSTDLLSFTPDEDGVTSVIRSRDGGEETVLRSQYLIAADGAHSPVREHLGIRRLGRGQFARCVTIYFKAEMKEMMRERNLSVVYVRHPELLGFFRFSIDADAGFLVVFSLIDERGERSSPVGQDLTLEKSAALVRKALGCPEDFAVQVENVQEWDAEARWAEQFSQGRVFLAGDSAHTMPPTGGFGGNTGVADGHNLAWKLAAVIKGSASPDLLETYDAERRPVSALTVEQAYTRYVLRIDPGLDQEGLAPTLEDTLIELGTVYRSDAVISEDSEGRGENVQFDDPRKPEGIPGARVAHVEIKRNGEPCSVLDLFGHHFVLLAGEEGGAWCQAAESVSASRGTQIDAYRTGPRGGIESPSGQLEQALGIGTEGAVLVRPDGVIAWRAAQSAKDPVDELAAVCGRLLGDR